jgi:hypothetical protein
MSDVVISYARQDQPLAKELAKHLQLLGFLVWWDIELLGCDDFNDVIHAKLLEARAVIVIWSSASVKSTFVRDEARLALKHRKLVATKARALNVDSIPFGFRGQHADDIDDYDKIVRAIEALGARRMSEKGADNDVLQSEQKTKRNAQAAGPATSCPKTNLTPRVSALRIKQRNGDTRIFAVRPGGTYMVGRDKDMHIVLAEHDLSVSRQHAKLIVHDHYVEVIDQGSTNKIQTSKTDRRKLNHVKVELHESFFLGWAEFVVVP